MNPVIALYAKPPIAGRTKSRLAAEVGKDSAASLAEAMLLDNLTILAETAGISAELWIPPDANKADFKIEIPTSISIHAQEGPDLGLRMAHTISDALERGAPACIIIGSDCVTHCTSNLRRAVRLLVYSDLVIQPTADGGFVLLGATAPCQSILENRKWGGPSVMADLRNRLQKRTLAELPLTHDVDLVSDLSHAEKWVHAYRPTGFVATWFAHR